MHMKLRDCAARSRSFARRNNLHVERDEDVDPIQRRRFAILRNAEFAVIFQRTVIITFGIVNEKRYAYF